VCRKSEHRDRIDAMLAAAHGHVVDEQPLRFVPGAARAGALVFRGDAASIELSEPAC